MRTPSRRVIGDIVGSHTGPIYHVDVIAQQARCSDHLIAHLI